MAKGEMVKVPFSKTYFPTFEDFRDPMEYLSKIKSEAEKFGIIKIVPPKNWRPPFSMQFDKKIIDARIQDLSDIEGTTRVRNIFTHNLAVVMEALPIKAAVPNVDGKPIDLFRLFKIVEANGGYRPNEKKYKFWRSLLSEFDIKSDVFYAPLRSVYEKILFPFAEIMKLFERTRVKMKKKVSRKRALESCAVCDSDSKVNLECRSCDSVFHKECIPDYLKIYVHSPRFICADCILESLEEDYHDNKYAFDMSDTQKYTLNEFKNLSDNFYEKHIGNKILSPVEMEEKYWKLLRDPTGELNVRYGADLASSVVGSGFPTTKSESSDDAFDYHTSWWNLNNLPNHPKSVTSFIRQEISGIKVPWVYVGSCLSTFCWHVEDHWSCSINYNHIGAIKTWYGIPSSDAERFDKKVRDLFPELFDGQSDLMHHLVTTIDPIVLMNHDIKIFKIHQNAGEFVVTFSRAYHAGFNQGFNCAEAVNFCFDDWIPFARSALYAYKIDKRTPVFSHEELVLQIAESILERHLDMKSNQNATFIQSVIEDINYMIKKVDEVSKEVEQLEENEEEKAGSEDVLCNFCKTICYFATIHCINHSSIRGCVDHLRDICDCSSDSKKLICRIPVGTVRQNVNKIAALLK